MPKVTNQNQSPTLNCVEQGVNSPIITFITDCGKSIDVQEQQIIDYIEAAALNVSYEWDENEYTGDPVEIECTMDAKEYLEDNFEMVTNMYFDQVIILTIREASNFVQGYAKSLISQGIPVDGSQLANIEKHLRNQYGINMRAA